MWIVNTVFLLVQTCVCIYVSKRAVCIEFAVECAWIHVQLWILTMHYMGIYIYISFTSIDAVNNFTILISEKGKPSSKCLVGVTSQTRKHHHNSAILSRQLSRNFHRTNKANTGGVQLYSLLRSVDPKERTM